MVFNLKARAFLLLLTHAQLIYSIEPSGFHCDFYQDLDEKKNCSADKDANYLIGFGYYFCNKFGPLMEKWTTQDPKTVWSFEVRRCLQRELLNYTNKNAESSCQEIQDFAFDSHRGCYVESGFCQLKLNDQKEILEGLTDIKILEEFSTIKQQGLDVFGDCYIQPLVDVTDAVKKTSLLSRLQKRKLPYRRKEIKPIVYPHVNRFNYKKTSFSLRNFLLSIGWR